MTVATQEERARGAGRAAQLLAAAPDVIGVHWFQYADEPPGGRADGEDYNFGLVDTDDRPYDKLIRALSASNRLARWGMARAIAPEPGDARNLVLPRADIAPMTQTLADWPKAASLVPMIASPGEVPFGEMHLAWNERRPVSRDDRDGLLRAGTARAGQRHSRAPRRSASRWGSMPAPGPVTDRAASNYASFRIRWRRHRETHRS